MYKIPLTNYMRLYLILFFLLVYAFPGFAQKGKMPKPETVIVSSTTDSIDAMLDDYERVQLPSLSIFLESVMEHPSVRIYEAKRDAANAELKIVKRKWLNYLRGVASYQYGKMVSVNGFSDTETPLYYTSNGISQNQYYAGVSLSLPLGDILSQKQNVRVQKSRLRQMEYEYAITIEERKLIILEAYNRVLEELSVLKAKAEAAALYNAQMKISEQDFINGKIDIISLSMERSRRSAALVTYQSGRVALQNAITLLEMLTNVKIIQQ